MYITLFSITNSEIFSTKHERFFFLALSPAKLLLWLVTILYNILKSFKDVTNIRINYSFKKKKNCQPFCEFCHDANASDLTFIIMYTNI